MPVELILSPFMKPVVIANSWLSSMTRSSSKFQPIIIEMPDPKSVSSYVVLKRFGSGSKIFDVFDTYKGQFPTGSNDPGDTVYWFSRSRAVKGAYKMFSSSIKGTGPEGEDEPVANLRAGLRSNVLLIRAPDVPAAELGWHTINHKVDAIDTYKTFTLSNGITYQWTTNGKWLEMVANEGERTSEIRHRIGQVSINGVNGFTLTIEESKIPLELALATSLISFLDQWSTSLTQGGIFYRKTKKRRLWRRV